MSFSEIRISGGTVTIRDDTRELSERMTGVDMSLAWPAISKSFAATGRMPGATSRSISASASRILSPPCAGSGPD
jgi:hypothetical protein